MTVIKAFSNSWVTSDRFHEDIRLPCIFGCQDCKDSLAHYLECDILWTTIICTYGLDTSWLKASASQRLGLTNPSKTSLTLIAVASRSYHAIKMGNKEVIQQTMRDKDFHRIQNLLFEFAAIFSKELR